MFDCGQKEEVFWLTMNPRRLHALFNARFNRSGIQAHSPAPAQKTERSLMQYLMGGG